MATATPRGPPGPNQCGLNAAPIAAPLTGRGVPVSPPYPPVLNAVAFDARGTLYVPDYANARIQTWTPNATAWVTIIQGNAGPGAPDPADPARASAMAVAAGGTVYTINSYISELPGSVYKWAPGASTPVIIGIGLSGPLGIALSPQGYVYVVDGYPRVVRFDPSGPPGSLGVARAGMNGRGPAANQFDGASGIWVDGNQNLYICDTNNNRVQKWAFGAATGQTVAGGNGQGSGASQLNQPAGIALDPAGDINVSDSGNCRIQIWEPNVGVGVPVARGQGPGSEVDQLNWPRGIMRRGNTLYVADTGNARIMAWDLA